MSKNENVKERAKICLQEFANGVMLGYRIRIFKAIDGVIEEVKTKTLKCSAQTDYINGLKEAKNLIEKLK